MRKYTHVKLIQSNVDRAVGFIESMVTNSGSPIDYARNQAKAFYNLSAVESAIAMERYYEVTAEREVAQAEEYQPKPLDADAEKRESKGGEPVSVPAGKTPKSESKTEVAKAK